MERTKSTSRVIERTINIQEPTGRKNKKQKAGNTVLDGAKKLNEQNREKYRKLNKANITFLGGSETRKIWSHF